MSTKKPVAKAVQTVKKAVKKVVAKLRHLDADEVLPLVVRGSLVVRDIAALSDGATSEEIAALLKDIRGLEEAVREALED